MCSVQEGETIRILVKTKPGSGAGMLSSATGATNVLSSTSCMKAPLAPPPGGVRIRSPLPPPPDDGRSLRSSSMPISGTTFASTVEFGRSSGSPWDSGTGSTQTSLYLSKLEVLLALQNRSYQDLSRFCMCHYSCCFQGLKLPWYVISFGATVYVVFE